MKVTWALYRATLALLLGLAGVMQSAAAGPAPGGKPWQIGDVVVCFGNGTCNVLRISGNSVTLLDQISDGLLGSTNGVAINNSLHLLVTDNAADNLPHGNGSTSNVFEYTIASIDPLPNPGVNIAHTPITTAPFNDGGGNATALVVNAAGHIFVGNEGSGGTPTPTIAEFNPDGTQPGSPALGTNPFTLPGNCTDNKGSSAVMYMDLSADGSAFYITTGGPTVQKLTISGRTCAPFANFGGNVQLHGIKDIPAGALPANCGSSITNPSVACPGDESILVIATGNTDPDATTGETETAPDADAIDICTNKPAGAIDSCALLLDTNPSDPALTTALWQAATLYNLNTSISDPSLNLQTVFTAGTSGGEEPTFDDKNGTAIIDNAVKWTDIRQPLWTANKQYSTAGTTPSPTTAATTGTFFVDPNGNLQTVSAPVPGTSGPIEPGAAGNPVSWATVNGGTTIDGLQWQDQGAWQAMHLFATPGAPVGDASGHVHEVLIAGTSGGGALPAGGWNDSGGTTIDNAVQWTNQGAVVPYATNHSFGLTKQFVIEGGHAQLASEPGTSGPSAPNFSMTGGMTQDGGVTWTDQGLRPWHPNFAFAINAVIVDPAQHVQVATGGGTSGPAQPSFNEGSTTTDGLQWLDQGQPVAGGWAATTAFGNGNFIIDGNMHVQEAVIGGTSGGSTPTFSMNGGYALDGSVVWLDQGGETYQTNHPYSVNNAIFDGKDVQQATTAGTSGGTAAVFADNPGTATPDNAVVWTDEGQLIWQANFGYAATTPATTYVVDPAHHLQQATIAGTSGPGAPAFNDGGTTIDGSTLQWTDEGLRFWHPASFAANSFVVDPAGHLQLATTGGASGPTQPVFNDSNSSITDGLQWSDQGPPVAGGWAASTGFSQNQFIVDNSSPTPHVQEVVVTGTSGGGPNPPTFNTSGGLTVDNTVVWIDRGVSTYQTNNPYGVGAAFSDGTDIQQALTAGTSGGTEPTFADTLAKITPDNAVVWADEGTSAWQMNFSYDDSSPAATYIIDPTKHVQQATVAGTSGGSQPTFNDGGMVYDGLLWQDIGPVTAWTASTSFPIGTLTVDTNSFLEKVTTAGISTTPMHPGWNAVVGGATVDGLQWTDQGQMVWQASNLYSVGHLISDSATHAQKVFEAGTSEPGPNPPTFNDLGGLTIDNAVTWTESDPVRATSTAYIFNAVVLDTPGTPGAHVERVSLAGTTGPSTMATAFSRSGQTVIDGLQWQIQSSPPTSVVARYPVTGTNTLQPLALDPLIADCTGSNCSSSLTTRKISNFWMGDNSSPNFYRLDFASGMPTSFSANINCAGCAAVSKVEGLGVYGAEGSNQPGLTKLYAPPLNPPLQSGNSFTANVNFPLPSSASTNSWTVTAYPTANNVLSPIPVTLYASLLNGTNGGATDPNTQQASGTNPTGQFEGNNFPCQPTASGNCIVWKADLQLPPQSVLAENITAPSGIDFGTDVFVDEHYDVTDAEGPLDPPGKTYGSVHSLNEVPSKFQTSNGPNLSGCTYVSPAPAGGCFKSGRGTLPFEFKCTNVPFNQFQNLQNRPGPPLLSIVKTSTAQAGQPKPAPDPITLTTTNSKAPFRFNGTDYIFNWSPNGITGSFTACTFDPTGTVQTFCTKFTMKTSRP